MTVQEPRFTRAEVDMLIASRRQDQEPRGAHGFTITEATDPDVQWRVNVDLPTRDYIQQAIDREREAYRKQWGEKAEMGSLLFRASLN